MKINLFKLIPVLLFTSALASGDSDIVGVWVNSDGEGLIELSIENDVLSGKILGNSKSGESGRIDSNNPDPELRDRPLKGLVFLKDFVEKKPGHWKGGTIYDPNNGKTYKCKITQIDADTIEIRGYIGISLIGRTVTWKRQK